MKAWFVYEINGELFGFWANNNVEAEERIYNKFGNVEFKFSGISYGESCPFGPQPDKYVFDDLTTTEFMIASGLIDYFAELAKRRFYR